jgi:hypothetical protein
MQDDAVRYFSLEEANSLLPEIREMMAVLQQKKKQLDDHRWQLAGLAQRAKGNGVAAEEKAADLQSAVEMLVEEITTLVNEVQGFGCEVKDLDIGLLDFRSLRDGRPVYLCWKLGEDDIAYWHELDTGYAGRQPL